MYLHEYHLSVPLAFAINAQCISYRLKLVLLLFAISAMTSRTVKIIGVSGHLLDLEIPRQDISSWEIRCEIKRKAGIHRHVQRIMWGDTALAQRSKIPNGDDVTRNLVRVKAMCGNCGRRQRLHRHFLFCSDCLDVAYCDSACQRSDGKGHRLLCCKCNG